MIEPKFNNVSNENIQLKYKDIDLNVHISRSVAVVGVVIAYYDNSFNVLITKRSEKMIDEPGKISLPCGFLDWNERLYDAMIREVHEETSLYLPDYEKYCIFNNDKKHFYLNDNPLTNRQNVTLSYITVLDFKDYSQNIPFDIENYSCVETSWVKWLKIINAYTADYDWAFNHDETIKNAFNFFNTNYKNK